MRAAVRRRSHITVGTLAVLVGGVLGTATPAGAVSTDGLALSCGVATTEPAPQIKCSTEGGASTPASGPVEFRFHPAGLGWSSWQPGDADGSLTLPAASTTAIEARVTSADGISTASDHVDLGAKLAARLTSGMLPPDATPSCGSRPATMIVQQGSEIVGTPGPDTVAIASDDPSVMTQVPWTDPAASSSQSATAGTSTADVTNDQPQASSSATEAPASDPAPYAESPQDPAGPPPLDPAVETHPVGAEPGPQALDPSEDTVCQIPPVAIPQPVAADGHAASLEPGTMASRAATAGVPGAAILGAESDQPLATASPTTLSAAAAGPYPSKVFGYHENFVDPVSGSANLGYVDWAANGQSNYIRVTVQGCPGFSNWGPYEQVFSRAASYNIGIVLNVHWATGCSGSGSWGGASDEPLFQEFVRSAVNQAVWFNGKAPYVEVWNEPNLADYWGGPPDPYWYADAFWSAWNGVQESEADWGYGFNAPVMTAGPGRPTLTCGENSSAAMCAQTFLSQTRDVLNSWASGGMIEMSGVHIYPHQSWITAATSLNEAADQFNNVRVPLPYVSTMATEVGIRSGGTTPGGTYTPTVQCNRLLDIYDYLMPSSVFVGMIVWRLQDGGGTGGLPWMGVIDGSGSSKPAYWALAARRTGVGASC